MKCLLLLSFLLTGSMVLMAQRKDTSLIAHELTDDQVLAPLKYLASDHLRGRHIGLPEIDTAAEYIVDQLRKAGAKAVPGQHGYYQIFNYQFSPMNRSRMNRQVAANIPWWRTRGVTLKNILAYVPGTDPILSSEYVVLSAHYDHVGVTDSAIMENGKMDSIFNGARDNATGAAAVIDAARYFAQHPPKRSMLFICYTAEEEGEIGSNYYAQHPLVPLDHTVFNLNVDNAGYDTTHAICLFGLGRTSVDSLIRKACMTYGLAVLPEPEGQELFKRSDNYALAQKGIPAPTYSLGMTDWDGDVWDRYHRMSDEVDNMDLGYVVKFIRAYILSAQYIANDRLQPKWTKGDLYEKVWQTLFGKNQ